VKDWKIHLAWALAVPIIAFLWGRWIVARPEPDLGARGAVAQGRPPRPEQASMSTPVPAQIQSPAGSPIPREAEDYVAKLRRLLRSEKEADRSEGSLLLHRVPNGSEKRELVLLELASPDHRLRLSALTQYDLLQLLGADAVPLVQDMLKSDPEAYLRRIAAELLGSMGGTGTMEALLSAVHDPERYVQVTAAGVLNRLGQPGPAEDLVPRVAADLSSPDGAVRHEAVKDLTLLKLPSTIPILLRSLRDSDGDVRLRAAMGLGELESPDLLQSLEGLRKDPDPNVAGIAEIAITRYLRKKR
jgi:HEAT repeat protein